ncbi:hypothetical protein STHU_36380 [Allostella humosa]|uniref:ELWxxDGT repeat protein n=1 Tax=Stella humosa TaxID=94 RepID=UPI0011344B56|nr:ELWxxDGT repeat protein [Stella humosa]BBK33004.1 hypothetical protein STHU_36380 [Stella humosa]
MADIIAGVTGSEPGPPAVLGEAILFAAGAPGDTELWRFDGTTVSRVADILPGAIGSEPAGFAVLDGIAYFSAADVRGREIWRSDGTADGTRLVADIKETGSSEPEDLVVLDGRLFFNADDGVHGRELWVSDGTPEGTGMLVDINPAGTGLPRGMVVIEAAAPAADTIPPDSWVQSGPPVDTDSTTATFVFSSDEEGVRFETALDGGQWQAAGASATFTGLAPGDHVLLVRAIDGAGNADPTPAIYPWSIGAPSPDTIPPDTVIQSGPPVTGDAGRDATFVFGSDEDQAAFEVSLDGGPYMTVLNPLVMRDLATGQHALLVRAVDPAGNVDPTPAAYSWTVGADSGGPGAVIRTGPAASSTAAVAIFDLEDAPAGRSFEGRLDGGTWQPAGDPVALFGLTAGPHRYEVRMVGAGADPTPAAWTWTIAPEPAVTDPGPAPVAGGKILVVEHFTDLLDPAIGDDVGWIQTRDSIRMPDGVANLTLLGADELNADGNDRANLMLGNAAANILLGQGGRDAIHGGAGGDFLAGGLGDDTILGDEDAEGASGDDTIWGGQGNDSILGGAGRDALNGDLGADTLLGGADADTLNGGAGDDRLDAGSGADLLRGGRGDDLLLGGAGADTLAGDLGSDTLWGGEGADQFLTMTAAADPGAVDVVADFTVGVDRLWIDAATGIIDEATFRARAHDGGEMTLLDLGQNGWIVLLGLRPDEIGLADLLIL